MRYSLEEVFGSSKKELASFKSRKVTKTGFYFNINNLVVLEDEETVIGVLGFRSKGKYSLIMHQNYDHLTLVNISLNPYNIGFEN